MIEQFIPQIKSIAELLPLIGVLFYMQRQSLRKLDELIESNHEIKSTVKEQGVKLEYGDREFKTISEHQKEQDTWIQELRSRYHDMVNNTVTHEQLKILLEIKDK